MKERGGVRGAERGRGGRRKGRDESNSSEEGNRNRLKRGTNRNGRNDEKVGEHRLFKTMMK